MELDESKLKKKFLYHLLNTTSVREQIKATATGATVRHTAPDRIYSVRVTVPDPSTQQRIADVLSAYEDLIENNTRRIRILEQMAQLLYREWFVNFRFPGHEKVRMVESEMGLIPEGWAEAKFTDLADVLSGGTPKTTEPLFWDGEIPFFGPVDAPGGYFVVDTKRSITPLGLSRCNSKLYPEETVFITARGTVGKVALPSVPMAMNQSCYALRPKNGLGKLFLFMMTKDCTERLQQKATGAVFDAITVDTFDRLEVIRPPEVLTLNFDATVRPMFGMMLNLEVKNKNLRITRDLLLPKLVSGEVSVETLEEEALAETV